MRRASRSNNDDYKTGVRAPLGVSSPEENLPAGGWTLGSARQPVSTLSFLPIGRIGSGKMVSSTASLDELLKGFIDTSVLSGRKDLARRRRCIILDFLSAMSLQRTREITAPLIRSYLATKLLDGKSGKTACNYLAVISTWCDYLVDAHELREKARVIGPSLRRRWMAFAPSLSLGRGTRCHVPPVFARSTGFALFSVVALNIEPFLVTRAKDGGT